jgi:hypothetical protein
MEMQTRCENKKAPGKNQGLSEKRTDGSLQGVLF